MIDKKSAALLRPHRTYIEHLWKSVFLSKRDTEMQKMGTFIKPGSTVLDIGANVGNYSRYFSKLVGEDGWVIAFEPQNIPRSILTVVSFFKRSNNIFVIPIALSDKSGLATLSIPIKKSGSIGINLSQFSDLQGVEKRFEVRKDLVPMLTLDETMAHIQCENLSMIKIDVEGAELRVLRGGLETIKIHNPVIIVEMVGRGENIHMGTDAIRQLFDEINYEPFDLITGELVTDNHFPTDTVFKPKNIR